jgi:hypothetical protein
MSLLTKEQIAELILVHDKWLHGNKNFQEYLIKWNEKQTPLTQFEPNWDKAHCNATSVYLKAVWYDREMKQLERTTICGWDRPVTPHPHAEMIMKYAEVAQRRVDPWIEFEYSFDKDADYWSICDVEIRFLVDGRRYRHIGETK